MVSLIYDKRAMAIYWEILDKKGSSNLEEQQRVRQFKNETHQPQELTEKGSSGIVRSIQH